MKEIGLIIDRRGGRNVFEKYAIEIEKSKVEGDITFFLDGFRDKIISIERRLQDLSENVNASNENEENIYDVTIKESLHLMNNWLVLFQERNKFPNILDAFNYDLDELANYVDIKNVQEKVIGKIKNDFEFLFTLKSNYVEEYNQQSKLLEMNGDLEEKKFDKLNAWIVNRVIYELDIKTQKNIDNLIEDKRKNDSILEDGEDVLYTWDVDIWIGTHNAVEANKFMNIVSSVLGAIENVEIEITEAGVGSFFQRWILRFRGWISKDDTVRVVEQGLKALEAYTLERHIEPVEKSKIERKKAEEEIKRMMSEEQSKEMNDLIVQEKREDLKAKKLANLKNELEIRKTLSEILANQLYDINSDFKIMINGIQLIKQENKQLEIGKIEDVEKDEKKEKINLPDKS